MKSAMPILLFMTSLWGYAQLRTSPGSQPKELGEVSWYRDYDEALNKAKKEDKSVLMLFQEVPGCGTCVQYGEQVLSYPLMVEVIENLFVPLVIYNNKGGNDAQILKRYKEPSWNNPVVRIVDAQGVNVVSRLAGNYTSNGLTNSMEEALIQTNAAIPGYFNMLQADINLQSNPNLKTAYYKMYCFWTGEKRLGEAPSILATETGFIGGNEVVKLMYDPDLFSKSALESFAQKANCKTIENNGNFRKSSKDQYFQLRNSDFKYLPLTSTQKTKINSAIGNQQDPTIYLSPRQLIWWQEIRSGEIKSNIYVDIPFEKAWQDRMKL